MAKTAYNMLDYTAAVARLRTLETRILGAVELDKLLNSSSEDEAVKLLGNLGWNVSDDCEEMLGFEMANVFSLIESLGGGEFLKTQRIKYDYHNLKVLIKSELTQQSSDDLMINFGSIKAFDLKNAVLNRDYHVLTPAMRLALPQAYEQYARVKDVQLVDIMLDSAMFKDMWEYTVNQPEKKILDLIKIQIDMHNIKTFVRVRKMNKSYGFIENVIANGGTIPNSFFTSQISVKAESEGSIFERTPYSKAFAQGANLELELDNLFLEKVKTARLGAFGLAPLAAYFWMKENEIRNVRIILICKKAGISVEAIRRRLRR
jgi:V/A-type H+-transporting ATPase subunit C